MVLQGREVSETDVGLIRACWRSNRRGAGPTERGALPALGLAQRGGRFKEMAARTLLLKLERLGYIDLPARQRPSSNGPVAVSSDIRAIHCGWWRSPTARAQEPPPAGPAVL